MKKLITKFIFGGIVVLLVITLIVYVTSQNSSVNTSTLQLVAIVHRHGFRTPTETYTTDPYQEKTWPVAFGQLLQQGKQQLYRLGKTFRERYKAYISSYASTTVKVRTSDVDRCHMSGGALLAGWFPPETEYELWNKELKWQPIPIHSVPFNEDNMLAQNKTCPKYNLEKEKVDKEIKANETAEDTSLYEYLTNNMGQKIWNVRQVEIFYVTLTIEKLYGLTLPEWTKEVYPDKMLEKAKISVMSFQWTKTMRRLSAGPFFNELFKQFIKKKNRESEDLKLLLYSAHDTTLTSIWQGLEFEGVLMPDFGSSLIFELHRENNNYFVKLFHFKNTEVTEPEELHIPKCTSTCSLDTLLEISKDVRPEDWEKECAIEK